MFLCSFETFPVIITSDLDDSRERKLINVFKVHKKAIGCTIADIKVISPIVLMHIIHLEDDSKTSCESQRHLNLVMQEVVRVEVLKLLDVCIIYPISNGKWVSPI